MTSVEETAAVEIHPAGLSTWLSHTKEQWQQFRNPVYCPNTKSFDDQCRQHGKVCIIKQYAGIRNARGNWTSDTWTQNQAYNWSIGQWQLRAVGHACVANLCDISDWATQTLSYINSIYPDTPHSQEALAAGNAGPSEHIKIFVEVDCASGGELPSMAIRLGLHLSMDLSDIHGSQRYLEEFQKDFVKDIANALRIQKGSVNFVDVERVHLTAAELRLPKENFLQGQPYALPGNPYNQGQVRVTFELLHEATGMTTTTLAEELMDQLMDPASKLRGGTFTSKVIAEAGITEMRGDGATVSFRGGAFRANPVDESHSAEKCPLSKAAGLLLLLLGSMAV